MFTPSVQIQQSIQNIQSKIDQDITKVKNNSGAIHSIYLKRLNETAEKIDLECKQILSLLSSHDVSQPDSFSPAETLRLQLLNKQMMQHKEFFETCFQKCFE